MFDFKYAEFIVPAFAVTAIVFSAMIGLSLSHARRWRKRYEELTPKDGTIRDGTTRDGAARDRAAP
jgi:heme exporter protein CcmD